MRRPRYADPCGHEPAAFLGTISKKRRWRRCPIFGRTDRYDVYYVAHGERSSRVLVCLHAGNRPWECEALCRDDLRDWPEVRMLIEERLA